MASGPRARMGRRTHTAGGPRCRSFDRRCHRQPTPSPGWALEAGPRGPASRVCHRPARVAVTIAVRTDGSVRYTSWSASTRTGSRPVHPARRPTASAVRSLGAEPTATVTSPPQGVAVQVDEGDRGFVGDECLGVGARRGEGGVVAGDGGPEDGGQQDRLGTDEVAGLLSEVNLDWRHDRRSGGWPVGDDAGGGRLPSDHTVDDLCVADGEVEGDHASGADSDDRCRGQAQRADQRAGVVACCGAPPGQS